MAENKHSDILAHTINNNYANKAKIYDFVLNTKYNRGVLKDLKSFK